MIRKLTFVCLLLVLMAVSAIADTWTTAGFNFRSTSGYVTDPSGTTYVLPSDGSTGDGAYPVNRNLVGSGLQVTFGLNTIADNRRDRNAFAGASARLSGFSFKSNALSPAYNEFRLLLPNAGQYNIRLAAGDFQNARTNQRVRIIDSDGSTVLADINAASVPQFRYMDATGVVRTSDTDWLTNNAAASITFSGTTAYIRWGAHAGGSDLAMLNHVSFEFTGSTAVSHTNLLTMGVGTILAR